MSHSATLGALFVVNAVILLYLKTFYSINRSGLVTRRKRILIMSVPKSLYFNIYLCMIDTAVYRQDRHWGHYSICTFLIVECLLKNCMTVAVKANRLMVDTFLGYFGLQ